MKRIIIISVMLAIIFSTIMFLNYRNNKDIELVEAYFLQVGAYKEYKNVTNITKVLPNYLVVKEDNLYHIYVGISKKEENIEKIKVFYNKNGNNIYVRSKNIYCNDFIKNLETYDEILLEAKSPDMIQTVSKEILKNYDEVCIK